MAYEKVPRPSTVYHLTKKEHLDSILDDGVIRRFDDNALLTMRLDREQLKVLAAMDDPLEAVRSAWVSTQEMRQEEEFSHTLFEICEQTAQEQTMRMK